MTFRREFAREALIVAGAAAIGAVMWFASGPDLIFEDYLKAQHPAGAEVLAGGDGLVPLYRRVAWTYAPVLAWLFAPFGSLPPSQGALLYLAVGILAVVAATALLAHLSPSPERRWVPLALFLVNGPLIYSVKLGNTTHLVLLALVGVVVLLRHERSLLAGVLLGVSSMVKLPLLLIIVWLAARRRWTAAVSAVATIALILLLSLLEFGSGMVREWFVCCIGTHSRQPVASFNVQTLHAFTVRLMTGTDFLGDFKLVPMTAPLLWVRYFALALIVGAIIIAARSPRTRHWDLLTFSITLVVAIVASPLAWSHYHSMLLLPFTLYFMGVLGLARDRFTTRAMIISTVLCSLPVMYLKLYQGPVTSRTVVSATLVGACLLLVVLVRTAWSQRDASPLNAIASPAAHRG